MKNTWRILTVCFAAATILYAVGELFGGALFSVFASGLFLFFTLTYPGVAAVLNSRSNFSFIVFVPLIVFLGAIFLPDFFGDEIAIITTNVAFGSYLFYITICVYIYTKSGCYHDAWSIVGIVFAMMFPPIGHFFIRGNTSKKA